MDFLELPRGLEMEVKKEAILFANFRDQYRHIESMNVRHHNMQQYGSPTAITWVGASDDVIWEAYKKGEQLKRHYENNGQ